MTLILTKQPPWLLNFRNWLGIESGADVTLLETHISWILLVGSHAFKLKKPVVLPFVDYGTAIRRHFFCNEEVRLNRRFAPALYLDVVPVKGAGEWAVHMRRFDEAQRLDHVCARGELSLAHLAELARVITAFHEKAAVATVDSPFGSPAIVSALALANFSELHDQLPAERARLARLKQWTVSEFARVQARMLARKQAGRVRECHGDLHLGNLVLIDGQVTPFDCIEFNEDLRWIDVAAELAFTYVDLLDRQRPDLATWLLNEWLMCSGDFDALPVLRFHAVYRAIVRAKVAAIRGDAAAAADYLTLAEQVSMPPLPTLTITCGPAASGKTTLSRERMLADRHASTLHLRSDVERKRLFGLAPAADSQSALAEGIYSDDANARTYAHLAKLAADCLSAGWSVIVDASFLERRQRQVFQALAARCQVPFSILLCAAPAEVLAQRLAARQGDASEATPAVLARQLARMEPLDAAENAFAICTNGKPAAPLNKLAE
jgi:aminoglycoside phosphotransferase family enzyme/predicted kinase